jgi:tRNA-2-methylthio-N6-dimethylallyladenosine synthase
MDLVKKYENKSLKVLVEKEEFPGSGKLTGRSSQNKLVHFLGPADFIGHEVNVRITKAFPAVFRGEIQT